ncbi:short chain dehydrogenase [Colletotrichum incanum]|uniref:Short chain dehydrogenase n=1 Tax=Colletotrichum incanum TaxID=1573173 RepID=A0A162N0N1_COLIC|nr:short chain dehydrogenase [Colletotrichum incanum]
MELASAKVMELEPYVFYNHHRPCHFHSSPRRRGPHGVPPAVPIPPSEDPALCLKRLETHPNRSPKRFDILGDRCLQARTYKGKFGPYKGDFFFETCCKDKNDKFAKPTYVNVDECVIFDPVNGSLGWNNLNSQKIRDHCTQCEVEQIDKPEAGQSAGPYLSCTCQKND